MVVKSSALCCIFLVTLLAGPDPLDLVGRLGSPRYAEREAASSALEKLGQSAFPALKVARTDRDPEVKSRAEILLETIERSMLTRPSAIRLEARRYSLAELAELLSKSQGLPLPLGPLQDRVGSTRPSLELSSPETLPFWAILDRVGLVPEWSYEQQFGRPTVRRSTSTRLIARTETTAPAFDHGPFRLVARALVFEAEPNPQDALIRQRGFFQLPPNPRPQTPRETDLVIPIEVMPEPRLALRGFGAVRLLECMDDNDQPITPAQRTAVEPVFGFANQDRPPTMFQVRLRPPTIPANAIKRVRGVVSVEIEARKIEPTLISLSPRSLAEHRPIDCGGMRLQVQGLAPEDPGGRTGYVLDLTIHPDGWVAPAFPRRFGGNRRGPWDAPNFDPEQLLQNLEVVNAQGQPFRGSTPQVAGWDGDGVRIKLFLPNPGGTNTLPTELRVFGQIRASIEVPFEFHDLKLPGA